MVEFITLLLHLTLGPQQIHLTVQEPVTAVEIRVDGYTLSRLDGPPWQVGIDFGEALLPRRVEAIGLDASGQEISRVSQNINFGRANQEAKLVLEGHAQGESPRRGRVVWKTVKDWKPEHIQLKLNGKSLQVAADGTFQLPDYDEEALHFLEAEVVFPPLLWTDSSASRRAPLPSHDAYDFQGNMAQRRGPRYYTRQLEEEKTQVPGKTVEAHLVFGNLRGPNSSATLTALPIQWVPGFEMPELEAMQGWFAYEEDQPGLFSLSSEPGEVFIVFEHKKRKKIASVIKQLSKQFGETLPRGWSQSPSAYFISTIPSMDRGAPIFPSYKASQNHVDQGLLETLSRPTTRPSVKGTPSLVWDTIALAGRRAAQSNRVRAVLAIFDPASEDSSNLVAAQAAEYLAALRVPLLIWTPGSAAFDGIQGVPHYVGPNGFLALTTDLQGLLDRQQILWLEGDLLPQRIRLTSKAPKTVRLIGSPSKR